MCNIFCYLLYYGKNIFVHYALCYTVTEPLSFFFPCRHWGDSPAPHSIWIFALSPAVPRATAPSPPSWRMRRRMDAGWKIARYNRQSGGLWQRRLSLTLVPPPSYPRRSCHCNNFVFISPWKMSFLKSRTAPNKDKFISKPFVFLLWSRGLIFCLSVEIISPLRCV